MKVRAACLVPLLLIAAAVRADEIRLKDGTKITGTIVGYEDDSFKVQTSYGFALIRKDKVAEIIPSAPKPEPAPKPNPSATATAPAPPKQPPHAAASTPSPSSTATSAPAATPPSATAAPKAAPSSAGAPAAQANPAPQPTSDATRAPPIREEVVQNLYINHTDGFQLYKAPSWDLLPDQRGALPNAVAALGTPDGTTLLIVGREKLHGTLESQAAATDAQLRDLYENYRLLESEHKTVAGLPAIERKFRGTVADHDWSVTVLSVVRGGDVFTILGMTYADSDLIQIQENVIAHAMSSLQFFTP
ncbi:MAG: hypothetical protein ACLP1Y_14105 [Candidatus Acidiferrales bacterium]